MDNFNILLEGNDKSGWRVKEIKKVSFKHRQAILKEVSGKLYRTQKEAYESVARVIAGVLVSETVEKVNKKVH